MLFLFLIISFMACRETSFVDKQDLKTPIETHYETFGQGDPILIINGGPGFNSEGFAFIAQEIADLGYKTIIYDQRGTGGSKLDIVNRETITMDLMVQDIEDLRKKLKIDKWIVFGHSFGGILATHYAAKYPKRITKIIFSSSGGVNMNFRSYLADRINNNLTKAQKDSLNYYQKKLDAGDNSVRTIYKRASFLANAYVYYKGNAPTVAARLPQIDFKINSLVIQDLDKIKFNYLNKFPDFKQPVLIIQGKNDIISVETAEEIKQTFHNSKLVLLDNCGHYGWLDRKDLYMRAIGTFLNN